MNAKSTETLQSHSFLGEYYLFPVVEPVPVVESVPVVEPVPVVPVVPVPIVPVLLTVVPVPIPVPIKNGTITSLVSCRQGKLRCSVGSDRKSNSRVSRPPDSLIPLQTSQICSCSGQPFRNFFAVTSRFVKSKQR